LRCEEASADTKIYAAATGLFAAQVHRLQVACQCIRRLHCTAAM